MGVDGEQGRLAEEDVERRKSIYTLREISGVVTGVDVTK
jgi:hypothetical protein